jgi:hypothetical protein
VFGLEILVVLLLLLRAMTMGAIHVLETHECVVLVGHIVAPCKTHSLMSLIKMITSLFDENNPLAKYFINQGVYTYTLVSRTLAAVNTALLSAYKREAPSKENRSPVVNNSIWYQLQEVLLDEISIKYGTSHPVAPSTRTGQC